MDHLSSAQVLLLTWFSFGFYFGLGDLLLHLTEQAEFPKFSKRTITIYRYSQIFVACLLLLTGHCAVYVRYLSFVLMLGQIVLDSALHREQDKLSLYKKVLPFVAHVVTHLTIGRDTGIALRLLDALVFIVSALDGLYGLRPDKILIQEYAHCPMFQLQRIVDFGVAARSILAAVHVQMQLFDSDIFESKHAGLLTALLAYHLAVATVHTCAAFNFAHIVPIYSTFVQNEHARREQHHKELRAAAQGKSVEELDEIPDLDFGDDEDEE